MSGRQVLIQSRIRLGIREPALQLFHVHCVIALLTHWLTLALLHELACVGRGPTWLGVLVVNDHSFLWRLSWFHDVLIVVLDYICYSELLEIYFGYNW